MRKKYAVNWKFQIKYSLVAIAPLLVLGLLVTGTVYNIGKTVIVFQKQQLMTQIALLEQTLDTLKKNENDPKVIGDFRNNVKSLKTLSQDLVRINSAEWVGLKKVFLKVIAVFIIGGVVLGVLFSHRVAGPIARVQRLLSELDQNVDIPPIKVRPSDEFQEFYGTLERLHRKVVDDRERREKAAAKLSACVDVFQAKASSETSNAIREMRHEIEDLRR